MKLRSIICVVAVAAVASASALTSRNTFARLPVTGNTFQNALIAIPLAGCGETDSAIYVTNLVMTSNLKTGDKLLYRNGGVFYAWTLASDGGAWQECNISSTSGNSMSPSASQTLLGCGNGCWLVRSAETISADSTVYLFGQVNEDTIVTTNAAGTASAVAYSVISRPFETGSVDLSSWTGLTPADGDTVTVPDSVSATGQKTYTYRDGKGWTKQVSVATSGGRKTSYTVTDTALVANEVVIPAGVGFLYGRKATTDLVITWTK